MFIIKILHLISVHFWTYLKSCGERNRVELQNIFKKQVYLRPLSKICFVEF